MCKIFLIQYICPARLRYNLYRRFYHVWDTLIRFESGNSISQRPLLLPTRGAVWTPLSGELRKFCLEQTNNAGHLCRWQSLGTILLRNHLLMHPINDVTGRWWLYGIHVPWNILKRILSQTCKLFQPSLPYNKIWRNLFVPAILLPAKGLEQALGLQNDRRNKPKGSHIKLTTDKIPLRVGVFPSSVTQKLKLSVSMAHGPWPIIFPKHALREGPPNLSWPQRALSPLLEQWRLRSCHYWSIWEDQ